MTQPDIRFAYAPTPLGQLHYAEAGSGSPVLLLHQTPRSWDEYREVLPLLGRHRRAIAMDMYGFGMSAKPAPGTAHTIENFAEGAMALADALELDTFAVLGHHTGMFVASEVAARAPARVSAAVFSAGEYADNEFRATVSREMRGDGDPDSAAGDVDVAPIQEDGSHLMTLWAKRYPLYPTGRPDVLNRYIRDALAPGVDPAEGHRACARYVMEERVELVTAPVLLLANTADPVSYPHTDRVAEAYVNAKSVEVVEIAGGTVPVMEHKTADVVSAVEAFLDGVGA
ncbi:alpha/beta fold hydrolase [Gordonia aichiensis]|uniref:Putative hydrolase n=1 Tax=Gordonia aichiensis NBRC 108223 TaxID=1220583 RepID=L7KQ39_9ACTN|nr:alpha/beta hydrolase [Gordonia aichiensis]GAC50744.1 putative hydrolase [Gordonia aichiensis NBRC 108223]